MDWVHCNLCCVRPLQGRQFSLTNCGHIFCAQCAPPGCKQKCHICKEMCDTVLLTSKMPPDVEIYFSDPIELTKKIIEQSKQLLTVSQFQLIHRQKLTHVTLQRSKAQSGQWKELQRENSYLKEEVKYLKKVLEKQSSGGRTPPYPRGVSPGAPHPKHMPPHSKASPSSDISALSRPTISPNGSLHYQTPLRSSPTAKVTTGRIRLQNTPLIYTTIGGRTVVSPGSAMHPSSDQRMSIPLHPSRATVSPMHTSPAGMRGDGSGRWKAT